MAELMVQITDLEGLNRIPQNADISGDFFENSGKEVIEIINGDTADKTITVDSKKKCNYGYDHDAVVIVPAGESRILGPFSPSRFNDANGKTYISYSDITSLSINAIRVA